MKWRREVWGMKVAGRERDEPRKRCLDCESASRFLGC